MLKISRGKRSFERLDRHDALQARVECPHDRAETALAKRRLHAYRPSSYWSCRRRNCLPLRHLDALRTQKYFTGETILIRAVSANRVMVGEWVRHRSSVSIRRSNRPVSSIGSGHGTARGRFRLADMPIEGGGRPPAWGLGSTGGTDTMRERRLPSPVPV